MLRLRFQVVTFAIVFATGLAGVSHADGISSEDCAKIEAALKELAEANFAYAKMTEKFGTISFDFVVKSGGEDNPATDLNAEYSSALDMKPDLDGKIVGEGIAVFREVCPKN